MITNQEIEMMHECALKARLNSYSPYSNFKVGAAVLLKNGLLIGGCNIENASFGLTSCAERNTLFSTYNQGYKKQDIKAMLVLADTDGPCSPCGACRQVISELMNEDAPIILANLKKDFKVVTIKDLLPFYFAKEDMNV